MVTRITRGTLRPNTEQRVFDILRTAVQAGPKVPGLHSMSISRKVGRNGIELVAVTTWADMQAMTAMMGPAWQEPSWLPGLAECVVDSEVEMLETVVASVEELAELAPTG